MSELYDNLLKATSNIDDITTERYATVTKLNGNYCDVCTMTYYSCTSCSSVHP